MMSLPIFISAYPLVGSNRSAINPAGKIEESYPLWAAYCTIISSAKMKWRAQAEHNTDGFLLFGSLQAIGN